MIGVLEESGGIAGHIREILSFCNKRTAARVIYDADPEKLLDRCLVELKNR